MAHATGDSRWPPREPFTSGAAAFRLTGVVPVSLHASWFGNPGVIPAAPTPKASVCIARPRGGNANGAADFAGILIICGGHSAGRRATGHAARRGNVFSSFAALVCLLCARRGSTARKTNTTPFFPALFCVTRIASAQCFRGVGAKLRMSQPPSAIELSSDSEGSEDGSDTQSEDGLWERNARARGSNGNDGDVGQIPVPLAG